MRWETLPVVAVWGCWGLFALVWAAGAAYNLMRAPVVRRRPRAGFAWVLGGAAAWVGFRQVPGAGWRLVSVQSPWLMAVGALVVLAATGLVIWARVVLGKMWTASTAARDGHVLRTGGPYSVTRHPIYTGILGMLAGTALVGGLGRWLAVFALAVVWAEIRVHTEERLLAELFPGAYQQYRRRVPQFVPGLRRLRPARR